MARANFGAVGRTLDRQSGSGYRFWTMSAKPRIFSGMQPTGELHIGNYLGALREWVRITNAGEHEPFFCVVDAHATTVDYVARDMPKRSFDAALTYLAAGLDPDRATVFLQSDVPEHFELTWYLSIVTPMGDLHRMTQFKEKSDEHKQNVNAGLFTYPVLMAADILLYRASVVPVGDDQIQHLELSREICRRFNARFGKCFPEPLPRLSEAPRIMGLDGKSKMSKTRNNAIGLFDPAKTIEKKLKGAFTDEKKLRQGDPGRPEICNVFAIHKAVTCRETTDQIERECQSGALGCGECKRVCAESMQRELDPIRARADELSRDRAKVLGVLGQGAERARSVAQDTLTDVRRRMGLTTRSMR